jgi:L-ascorbate metabolism protein UlaG (beta-lactamase superfamily)
MLTLPRLTFIGHSTMLIEMGGRRIITDPVLFDRVIILRRVGRRLDAGSARWSSWRLPTRRWWVR